MMTSDDIVFMQQTLANNMTLLHFDLRHPQGVALVSYPAVQIGSA